ncbi:hypothetical protein T4D_10454 [Trichinella pseudospiralis]|uniref:Uncharacterized protein n=1 Tax=Trichinella pseudospiralis TaxID=6337 RepID=A0A0V1G1M2_TRIPS|nr:hypothetical protein T4D_10454 [Trichinella pseudospiralis]
MIKCHHINFTLYLHFKLQLSLCGDQFSSLSDRFLNSISRTRKYSNLQTLVRKIDLRLEDFSLGQHLQKELQLILLCSNGSVVILLPQTVVTEKKSLLYHLWVIRPSCQYTNQNYAI